MPVESLEVLKGYTKGESIFIYIPKLIRMGGWFMKNLNKANEWLQRAKSNMARAKAGRVSPDILNKVYLSESKLLT
jgi:hypothetical protein